MECHIDHEQNNEKLFSETAIPGPFLGWEWMEGKMPYNGSLERLRGFG